MAVHNVLDYGADPTDGSSDTPAIQAALDAASSGDTVYVPAVPDPDTDHYRITMEGGGAGINMDEDHNGITLEGDGFDSVLKMEGGISGNYRMIVLDEDNGSRLRDITIRGLNLDGNRSRQSSTNGSGIAIYLDDDSNDDENLLVEWIWAHDFTNTGIAVSRGALCRYCTSYDNDKHGFAPKGGGPGHRTVVEHCLAYGNYYYGGDQHGYGVVRDCYFHDNGYGFKWSGNWDPPNYPITQRVVTKNNRSMAFQMTSDIEEGVIEDIYAENCGSWGFRFARSGDVRIRGSGLLGKNINTRGGNNAAFGLSDVRFIDEADGAALRVDGVDGNAAANGRGASGSIDEMRWTGAEGDVYDGGGSVSFGRIYETTDVGEISNLPARSEVGAEAYNDGSGVEEPEPEPEPEPTGSRVALVTSNGYPVTASGYALTEAASAGGTGSPSGLTTVVDFEGLTLADSFDYGSRGFISTEENFEAGGSRSLAVGGSDGGFEEMVATPDAVAPLPTFFAKGESARYHLRASADTGYSGAVFAAASDQDFYSVNILWDLDGVLIYKKEGGAFSRIHRDLYLTDIGDIDRWYEVRIVRDDGTLGGDDNDVTVEIRDPSTDARELLWSHTFNDSTHASNVGVGLQTNQFDGSGEYTYLDYVVKED
jgi:hypothetical protein